MRRSILFVLVWSAIAAALLCPAAAPPVGDPTFSVAGVALENDLLVVRFKTTMPSGSYAAWDPDAAAKGIARLVTLDGGRWTWAVYTPELRGSGPVPPPPPPPPPPPVPGPLSVLVVYEQQDLGKYPTGQAAILTSKPIRDYLAAKCAKESGVPAFRFLDQNDDTAKLTPGLKTWFGRTKDRKLPTIILSNGKDTFEGDLPADPGAMLELLKKYGG